jgi:hypothetical protein
MKPPQTTIPQAPTSVNNAVDGTTRIVNYTRTFSCFTQSLLWSHTHWLRFSEDYAAKRRQQLRLPARPDHTRRCSEAVVSIKPDLSERGQLRLGRIHASSRRERAVAEQRTGQIVSSCERYFGPDGWSGGLCYGWFYYDDRDYIVDAEWQWHTD